MEPTSTYRADIDGLRAIAVLLVVLFHFRIGPVSGGFVGVDVFFVISGYLITTILTDAAVQRRLSLRQFYARRARRILPALLTVLLVSLLVGALILIPSDYEQLGWQSVFSALGVSNFFFWKSTGYFDRSADMIPLLHTWSLGIEEQFYLFWPLVVSLVAARGATSRIVTFATFTAVSLAISIYAVQAHPTAAFYLPLTRWWELSLGALVTCAGTIRNPRAASVYSFVGLLLILFSAFSFNETTAFPGLAALVPCIGAALLVWPKQTRGLAGRSLASVHLVAVGKMSYSIYLWHWPIWVFYRHYANGEMPSTVEAFALLAVTFAVSLVSYRYIEIPFRRSAQTLAATMRASFVAISLVLGASIGITSVSGMPDRGGEHAMPSLAQMWEWPCPGEVHFVATDDTLCVFGGDWRTAETRILLWGDSHAEHYAPILQAAIAEHHSVSVALLRGCPPIYGRSVFRIDTDPGRTPEKCRQSRDRGLKLIATERSIDFVFAAGAWHVPPSALYTMQDRGRPGTYDRGIQLFALGAIELAEDIGAFGVRLHILGNFPTWDTDPVLCVNSALLSLLRRPCSLEMSRTAYLARNGAANEGFMNASATHATISYNFPIQRLCDSDRCQVWLDGKFIYRDTNHIRRDLPYGSYLKLAEMSGVAEAIDTLLEPPPIQGDTD